MSVERVLNFGILLCLIVSLPSVVAAMPQITEDVETEFAIYSPYLVDVIPNVPPYSIDPKLANVINRDTFRFTDNEKSLLAQNGFVAGPSQAKQVYDVYNYCQERGIPIFVTSDSMLHTYHILFDYTLRILETREFYGELEGLNEAMLEIAILQYESATDPRAKIAAKKNVAYFTVASVLLEPKTPIPPEVKDLVEAELRLIEAHEGGLPSPIFGYREDYSQYVPRGHYTRSDLLERYFMSMMWYGRMIFHLKPREGVEKGKEETLQAILIVAAIKNAAIGAEPATEVWDRIYEPTVFFVGRTDDLNVYEYMELLADIYGPDFASLSPDALGDDAKLERFIEEAMELRNPMINSSFVFETEDMAEVTKGFRFMGQRFIPDSYMFQQLVHDAVMDRLFPKGLDAMAVLGSQRAYDILVDIYNEDRYPKYSAQIEKLRGEFAGMDDEMWAQNLYWNWLYVLMSLLVPKEEGYPVFMQNQAWVDKDLATALGSWAELRHDTILYAKQSYTFETSIPEGPSLVKGYVEPNAEFYARLASLAKFSREGLSNRGLLLPEFRYKFSQLEDLLLSLKEISELELADEPLSREQYGTIMNIGGTLEIITTFPPEIAGEIEGQEDEEMAVIADVHTDPNSGKVLEEGVGYPLNILVVVPVDGELRISQGPIFSYYEFTWPMDNRLTDGEWQDMLKTNPPELPVWMASFIDLAESRVTGERFSFEQRAAWRATEINVSIKPDVVEIGMKIEVRAIIYGRPDSPPVVTLQQADTIVQSEMSEESETFSVAEYVAVLDTSNFRPGTAQITVRACVGEEDLIYTDELILGGQRDVVEVWPGDTNNDGKVSMLDIIPIGRFWGKKGDKREPQGTEWQMGLTSTEKWDPPEAAFADADGNGLVDLEDIFVVAENWGKVHSGRTSAPKSVNRTNLLADGSVLCKYQMMYEALIRMEDAEGVIALREALRKLIFALKPEDSVLLANYPNPFNPDTWIPFALATEEEVVVSIYDVTGRLVRELMLGRLEAGHYVGKDKAAHWDGRNSNGEQVSSGMYFYKLQAGDFVAFGNMIAVK